jgi:small conductance mechanosensitive channel
MVEAQMLEDELKTLQKTWQLAKDRFQLAIDEHKTLQQNIATLQEKITQDTMALARLTGDAPPPAATAPVAPAHPAEGAPPTGTVPAATATGETPPPAAATPAHAAPLSPIPTAAAIAPASDAKDKGDQRSSVPSKPDSRELRQAREVAEAKLRAAKVASADADSIDSRTQALERNLALERQLRANARKMADNAHETERALASQVQRGLVEGADQAELQELWRKIGDAKTRYRDAINESHDRTDRIDGMQGQLANLQTEKHAAQEIAQRKRHEAELAERHVRDLENPFTIHNLLHWAAGHSLKIVLILLGMYVLRWFALMFGRRIFNLVTRRAARLEGNFVDVEARANTLASVFQHTASIVIITGGILMVFKEVGIDVTVLMGGVAVFGLAVAFGAQNLIKDYFTGFMILLENQYSLNDVVRIGETSGQVEQVTPRITVLRDIEGNVHFIPNGEITTVTNMTHGWSRAVFDVGIAYKEDVDRVMNVLIDLGQELRKDTYFGPMILENPTMLGVDSLGESAVTLKFFIKTRPLKQWEIKREMQRRIKNKFDLLKIEIPFPHRTVYFQQVGDGTLPTSQLEDSYAA